GIRLSFGSDAPVEDPNPLMGMHFAVNREEEAINLDEAIHAYTVDGAYFSYEEEYKGLLKEGYVADIAVFAEKMTNDNLKRNVCVATLIGGELVFQKQMN
ncbi:MAG: amidohydrolase family protein, partial [Bacillota bacterium]|nr:amidohydrolase family protein [Bacillota bacterium]